MNIFNFFKKKKEVDMQFLDISGAAQDKFPIRLAKHEPLMFAERQKEQYGKMKFHLCPGLIDYARYGYIVPAWDTVKIKANKAGVIAFQAQDSHVAGKKNGVGPMDHTLIDGLFEPEGVPLNAFKFDSPWKIKCNDNISALLMPAFYHSSLNDDVYTIPGIVDYKSFSTINWIFSVKRSCELIINAGEPLIHVIPFYNKEITANYGVADIDTIINSHTGIYGMFKHYYRKKESVAKKFNLKKT